MISKKYTSTKLLGFIPYEIELLKSVKTPYTDGTKKTYSI